MLILMCDEICHKYNNDDSNRNFHEGLNDTGTMRKRQLIFEKTYYSK